MSTSRSVFREDGTGTRPLRRVLMLAPYFLPRRRVGSMRPFRFAIHLREFGWEPTIVTIAAPDQRLTEKEARLLHGIRIVELRAPMDRTHRSESQLGAPGGEPFQLKRRTDAPMLNRLKSIGRVVIDELDRQFPADTWMLLFLARYPELVRTIRTINPDVLWATGDPWSSLVTGRQLSQRFHIPYVADFRDPWTLSNVRSEGLWPISRAANRALERRIIQDADLVLFQASRVEAMYRRHYHNIPYASTTITNSFDPEVFDDPVNLSGARARKVSAGDGIAIGFFGRFRAMSPATLMVDALRELNRIVPGAAQRIQVHSFGPLSDDDAWYADASGVRASFVTREAIPLERTLGALREFDLLLVSTEARRKEIIPAKLLEYIAAGRPILSFSRNPEVAAILERTGTGIQMDDARNVAALLKDCLRAADAGRSLPLPFEPRPDEIMKYEARRTTAQLASIFDRLVEPVGA